MPEKGRHYIKLVDSWMTSNLEVVTAVMEEARLEGIKGACNPQGPVFNPKRRYLSEMPICSFWEKVDPPAGFDRIHGTIAYPQIEAISGEFRPHFSTHWFARGKDIIFCLTPGQFVSYLARLEPGPGVRIEALQQRAPELIKVYDQEKGIAALFGTPNKIFCALWWEYAAEDEYRHYWPDPIILIQKYREQFGNTKFKMPHTTR